MTDKIVDLNTDPADRLKIFATLSNKTNVYVGRATSYAMAEMLVTAFRANPQPTEAAGWRDLQFVRDACSHTAAERSDRPQCNPKPETTADSEPIMWRPNEEYGTSANRFKGTEPKMTLNQAMKDCLDETYRKIKFAGDKPDSPELSQPIRPLSKAEYEELAVKGYDLPELSLLVIDLGNCCVVKVEKCETGKGEDVARMPPIHEIAGEKGEPFLTGNKWLDRRTFAQVREAIDAKPVPRIERMVGQDRYLLFQEKAQRSGYPNPSAIYQAEYDALSALAGHELPVWSGGAWEDLGCNVMATDIRMWRFTRK